MEILVLNENLICNTSKTDHSLIEFSAIPKQVNYITVKVPYTAFSSLITL